MKKGTRIINEVIQYINKARAAFSEITDDMLCDNGGIFYMNGNDGTDFDWKANGRCCELFLFYKTTELGFIKVFVNSDNTMSGYAYLNEDSGDPIELSKESFSSNDDALYLARLFFREADCKAIYDENINLINFDKTVDKSLCLF